MIYLIKSSGFSEENGDTKYFFLLKIGYTDDNRKDKRFASYKLHNPTCEILKEIPNATELHEHKLHYKFRNKKFENYGNEWYYYDQEIIDYFNNITIEDLDKLPIAENRVKRLSKSINEIRKIVDFLFDSEEDAKNYAEHLADKFGSLPIYEPIIKYIENDPNIDKEKLKIFYRIKESERTGIYVEDYELNKEISQFFQLYRVFTTVKDKMRLLCESGLSRDSINFILSQIPNSDVVKSYYKALGPDKLRHLGYNLISIKKELGIISFSSEILLNTIYSNFHVGENIPLSDIKNRLTKIYNSINYKKTPKARDIMNYFEVRNTVIYEKKSEGGRRQIRCYELIESFEATNNKNKMKN